MGLDSWYQEQAAQAQEKVYRASYAHGELRALVEMAQRDDWGREYALDHLGEVVERLRVGLALPDSCRVDGPAQPSTSTVDVDIKQ